MATSNKLRGQEVAALRRALDTERNTARAAQERARELQQALDSERSAVRALRRDAAALVRAARDEERQKNAALVDQLKTRLELAQEEAVAVAKESRMRSLTAQLQKEFHAREEELRRETKRQLEFLQEQLREAQKAAEVTPQSATDALITSLHADFHRTLHLKQEDWKRETTAQVEALTTQLRELQRLYTETCNQLTITTNEADIVPKLRQEIQTLKIHNKELEEKIQILTEIDRKKVEEFRALHEENASKIAQLQKAARKEAFQLVEEMKGKDRALSQLQREYHCLAARLSSHPYNSPRGRRSRMESPESGPSSLSTVPVPGDSSRLCIKRPKTLTFASDLNKRQRAQEGRKPPDPPDAGSVSRENGHSDVKNEHETNRDSSESQKEQPEGKIYSSGALDNWTKTVGVETLYQLLLTEHQQLQLKHHQTASRLREQECLRMQLEAQLHRSRSESNGGNGSVINTALAEQIQALQERIAELESEVQELREQNDLLEFRILEMDEAGCHHACPSFHFKSPVSRSPDTREREIDDVSDSGVMSLPTSEDISEPDLALQDFKMEPNNRDVKSKLSQLCQILENVSERISIQQALALLRHYEMRLESLEATLAAVCQEATQPKTFEQPPQSIMEQTKSPSRIIATVFPFTDLSSNYQGKEAKDDSPIKRLLRDQDCMQESGIFEDGGLMTCTVHVGTQTDWTFDPPKGDLGAEIRKLTQIRERIEEKGGNKRLLKSPDVDTEFLTHTSIKELLFYRDRVQMLEDKLVVYESRGDEQSRLLALRLEKEFLLAAQVKHLEEAVRNLKQENRILEEEKCEFEEAENDTRLRCQKLEVKLSALGEKKSELQVQLQQNARTMSNLRSTLSEEERKRNEARQYAAKLECLVNKLEQQNFEMEEKEMDVRYRLHTLENIVPAMVMYYLWRMLNAVRPFIDPEDKSIPTRSSSDTALVVRSQSSETCKKFFTTRNSQVVRETGLHDDLRIGLKEFDKFLNFNKKSDTQGFSSNIPPDSDFTLIEELSQRCYALEERVQELELKEKAYQETLQNGDEIFSKTEMDYKQKLAGLEHDLQQKQTELDRARSQLRNYISNQEQESQMQERINHLESEMSRIKDILGQREREKKSLEGEKIRLTNELEEAINNLEKFKETTERSLNEEIEHQKKKVKELVCDMNLLEQDKIETEERQKNVVKELKLINQHACRQLEENEVTISELKEEVQTLEREVSELRAALSHERDSRERLLIRAGAALEAERQLRSADVDTNPVGSLHDELLCATDLERPVDWSTAATAESPAVNIATLVPFDCVRTKQIIEKFDTDQPLNNLDRITAAFQHSKSCNQCKDAVAVELRNILHIMKKTVPSSKMAQINHLLLLR